MQTNGPPRFLRFGIFEVDLRAGRLTKHGLRLKLQDQPFQVLATLLEKPGELVSREELRSRLWPRTIVDFDQGLNKAINKIRDALGDSAESPRFIETVARRGYRFLADVETINAPSPQSDATPDVGDADRASAPGGVWKRLRYSRAWRLFGFSQALLLAAALLWIVYPWSSSSKIRSLAVLPLENLSGDASQAHPHGLGPCIMHCAPVQRICAAKPTNVGNGSEFRSSTLSTGAGFRAKSNVQ